MSATDRLAEIENRIDEGYGDRVALCDAPAMLAALRAVLKLCDSTPEPYMPVSQADIRSAIEAELKEGQ